MNFSSSSMVAATVVFGKIFFMTVSAAAAWSRFLAGCLRLGGRRFYVSGLVKAFTLVVT